MTTRQEKITLEASKPLKQVLARAGLSGNFGLVIRPKLQKAEDVGLSVTSLAKDPQGSKMLAQTRTLRNEIGTGRKIGLGVVSNQSKKLGFELVGGDLKDAQLARRALRLLADEHKALAFLKAAVVTLAGKILSDKDRQEQEVVELSQEDIDELRAEIPKEELDSLLEDEQNLSQQSERLRKVLATNQSLDAKLQSQIAATLDALDQKTKQLSQDDLEPDERQKLEAKFQHERYQLAESLSYGPNPFPVDQKQLSKEGVALLRAAEEKAGWILVENLRRSMNFIESIYEEVKQLGDTEQLFIDTDLLQQHLKAVQSLAAQLTEKKLFKQESGDK